MDSRKYIYIYTNLKIKSLEEIILDQKLRWSWYYVFHLFKTAIRWVKPESTHYAEKLWQLLFLQSNQILVLQCKTFWLELGCRIGMSKQLAGQLFKVDVLIFFQTIQSRGIKGLMPTKYHSRKDWHNKRTDLKYSKWIQSKERFTFPCQLLTPRKTVLPGPWRRASELLRRQPCNAAGDSQIYEWLWEKMV